MIAGCAKQEHVDAVGGGFSDTLVFPNGVERIPVGPSAQLPDVTLVLEQRPAFEVDESRAQIVRLAARALTASRSSATQPRGTRPSQLSGGTDV